MAVGIFDIIHFHESEQIREVNLMGKYLAVLIGLIAMVGGILLVVFVWWREFYELVFGCIPPLLFFGGLIALIAGISSIKDAKRTKQLEEEAAEEEEEEKKE
jgi:Co/Zn/Cd efflux system component